jgi:hypothetical protein
VSDEMRERLEENDFCLKEKKRKKWAEEVVLFGIKGIVFEIKIIMSSFIL